MNDIRVVCWNAASPTKKTSPLRRAFGEATGEEAGSAVVASPPPRTPRNGFSSSCFRQLPACLPDRPGLATRHLTPPTPAFIHEMREF